MHLHYNYSLSDERENEKEHDFIILGETFIAVIEVKTPENEKTLGDNLKKAVEQSQVAKQLIKNLAFKISLNFNPNFFRFVAFPNHKTDALIRKVGTVAYKPTAESSKQYFIEQGSNHFALISMPDEVKKLHKVQKAKQTQLKFDHVTLICGDNLDFSKWWLEKTACFENLEDDYKSLQDVLIAFWDMGPLEQKLPGEAKFELGDWIAIIDKQLKNGRITFERTDPKQIEDMRNDDIIKTTGNTDFIFAYPKPDKPDFKINIFYDIFQLEYLHRDQLEAFQDNDINHTFFPLKGAAGTGKTIVLLAKLFRFILQDEKNKAFFVHNTEKYAFSDDYNTPTERAMLEFQKLTGITFCDYLKEIKAGCEFDETCRHQIFLMIYPQQAEKKSYTSLDSVKD